METLCRKNWLGFTCVSVGSAGNYDSADGHHCSYLLYRPLAVGVAQHFWSAILEYNLPCIVNEAYECFDAYSLFGLQMYMLFQYMITHGQAVLYKITERKY